MSDTIKEGAKNSALGCCNKKEYPVKFFSTKFKYKFETGR
jgi:hypothetical protein